jgi:hypothetical protein
MACLCGDKYSRMTVCKNAKIVRKWTFLGPAGVFWPGPPSRMQRLISYKFDVILFVLSPAFVLGSTGMVSNENLNI